MTPNTDCLKCGAAMPEHDVRGQFGRLEFKISAYRCRHCAHWNDLKRRGKRKAARNTHSEIAR